MPMHLHHPVTAYARELTTITGRAFSALTMRDERGEEVAIYLPAGVAAAMLKAWEQSRRRGDVPGDVLGVEPDGPFTMPGERAAARARVLKGLNP